MMSQPKYRQASVLTHLSNLAPSKVVPFLVESFSGQFYSLLSTMVLFGINDAHSNLLVDPRCYSPKL